jgi:hypothetical protein
MGPIASTSGLGLRHQVIVDFDRLAAQVQILPDFAVDDSDDDVNSCRARLAMYAGALAIGGRGQDFKLRQGSTGTSSAPWAPFRRRPPRLKPSVRPLARRANAQYPALRFFTRRAISSRFPLASSSRNRRRVLMEYLSSQGRRWIGLAFCPAGVSCNCYRSGPLDRASAHRPQAPRLAS